MRCSAHRDRTESLLGDLGCSARSRGRPRVPERAPPRAPGFYPRPAPSAREERIASVCAHARAYARVRSCAIVPGRRRTCVRAFRSFRARIADPGGIQPIYLRKRCKSCPDTGAEFRQPFADLPAERRGKSGAQKYGEGVPKNPRRGAFRQVDGVP